ncbi:hypothetical protein ATANTOWER_013406 [Ataeniobius toweri]|uniref:Uncharacterized protein n=1 Tax=Ataeniobius toweri TaxID=208326 RepID=A0ABU7BPH5_9TELE|nr:hypothetical protein [Ataeniobius toweri]
MLTKKEAPALNQHLQAGLQSAAFHMDNQMSSGETCDGPCSHDNPSCTTCLDSTATLRSSLRYGSSWASPASNALNTRASHPGPYILVTWPLQQD